MSIETIVSLGHHVLSDYIGGIAGIHYIVNSLINLPVFTGAACAYTLLITIFYYTDDLYVAVCHGFYVLKHYFHFSN